MDLFENSIDKTKNWLPKNGTVNYYGKLFKIKIATLSGIFILKIIAWKDRHKENNKDADDIGFILANYLSIHEERAATYYYDTVYGREPFRNTAARAVLLGIDSKELLEHHPETITFILEILNEEIDKKEES